MFHDKAFEEGMALGGREISVGIDNQQIEKIRAAGILALKAGLKPWRATWDSFEKWEIPKEFPFDSGSSSVSGLDRLAEVSKSSLNSLLEKRKKAAAEEKLLDWLYRLIRHNIKRGRFWNLSDVLSRGHADCFGYAKLFSLLGRAFGLDTGIIEVLLKNSKKGRLISWS